MAIESDMAYIYFANLSTEFDNVDRKEVVTGYPVFFQVCRNRFDIAAIVRELNFWSGNFKIKILSKP